MKKVVNLKWKDNKIEVTTPNSKYSKTQKSIDMEMWRFKVLGEVPKGKRVKRTIAKFSIN